MLVEHMIHIINESPNLEYQDALVELDRVVLISDGTLEASGRCPVTDLLSLLRAH